MNRQGRYENCMMCNSEVDTALEPFLEDPDGSIICERCANLHFDGPDHYPADDEAEAQSS